MTDAVSPENPRRQWMKKSLLATAGAVLLPLESKARLEDEWRQSAVFSSLDRKAEQFWKLVRESFPLQKGLYYFNNASLGPSPELVVRATNEFRKQLDAYPSKYMWSGWKGEKEKVREKMAALLKVSPEQVALTHNTTEGMNLVASSLELEAGDEVILANHEHHTGTIPWIYHQERKGVKLVRPDLPLLPSSPAELVEIYRQAITPRTKVISLVHMTNTNGMIMPIKEISRMAHERGILVAVDGAQTVGMIDVDLAELECDFFAGSCHKWLFSPKGMGVFYARPESQHHLKAMIVCSGYKDQSMRRLENYNTRNLPELLGLGTALDFHQLLGAEEKYRRIRELKSYFLQGISRDSRYVCKTPVQEELSAGILTVELVGKTVKEIQAVLSEKYGIDCRPMTTHDLNGLRISLSVFNLKEDIDYLLTSLGEVLAD